MFYRDNEVPKDWGSLFISAGLAPGNLHVVDIETIYPPHAQSYIHSAYRSPARFPATSVFALLSHKLSPRCLVYWPHQDRSDTHKTDFNVMTTLESLASSYTFAISSHREFLKFSSLAPYRMSNKVL